MNDSRAAGLMISAVLLYSLVPLSIGLAGGPADPFMFGAVWRFGVFLGCVLFLVAFHRDLLLDRRTLRLAARLLLSPAMFWSCIGNLDYALFAWSARYGGLTVATALLETWPVWFMLLTERLLPARYRRNNLVFLALPLALAGVVLVVASRSGGLELPGPGLAIILLWLAGMGEVTRAEWLAAGLGLVVAANVVVTFSSLRECPPR